MVDEVDMVTCLYGGGEGVCHTGRTERLRPYAVGADEAGAGFLYGLNSADLHAILQNDQLTGVGAEKDVLDVHGNGAVIFRRIADGSVVTVNGGLIRGASTVQRLVGRCGHRARPARGVNGDAPRGRPNGGVTRKVKSHRAGILLNVYAVGREVVGIVVKRADTVDLLVTNRPVAVEGHGIHFCAVLIFQGGKRPEAAV